MRTFRALRAFLLTAALLSPSTGQSPAPQQPVKIRTNEELLDVLRTNQDVLEAQRLYREVSARVALAAHRVEECIQRAKSEAGLSHYEVRNWRGWHHHQTLSLIASWFLTREALRGKKMGAGNHRAADPRWHRDDPANRPPVRHANQNREQQDTPLGPKRGSPFLSLQST